MGTITVRTTGMLTWSCRLSMVWTVISVAATAVGDPTTAAICDILIADTAQPVVKTVRQTCSCDKQVGRRYFVKTWSRHWMG